MRSVTSVFTSRVTDCLACFCTPAALSTLLVALGKLLWFGRGPPSLSPPILTACRGGTGLRYSPADLVSITAQEQPTTALLTREKEPPPLYQRARADPRLSVRAGFGLPSAPPWRVSSEAPARERGAGLHRVLPLRSSPTSPPPGQPRRHPAPRRCSEKSPGVHELPRALCICFPSVLK